MTVSRPNVQQDGVTMNYMQVCVKKSARKYTLLNCLNFSLSQTPRVQILKIGLREQQALERKLRKRWQHSICCSLKLTPPSRTVRLPQNRLKLLRVHLQRLKRTPQVRKSKKKTKQLLLLVYQGVQMKNLER